MPHSKREIDNCPHTDRPYYAKGRCKSCYQKDFLKRKSADVDYELSEKGRERKAKYESQEKARERKRRWAKKNREKSLNQESHDYKSRKVQ